MNQRIKTKRALSVESLEGRDLMSASPLPVLLVVADQQDFYYSEYSNTRTAIESKGVGVVVGAATTNPTSPHWGTWGPGSIPANNGTITPDIALANANPNNYSAIAFVGGWGASMYQYAYNDPNGDGVTDNYYSNALYNGDTNLNDGIVAPQKIAANSLINAFLAANKPVAGLCHGVTVLAWARVDGVSPLAGKQVAVPHLEGTPDQFYAGAWRNGGYLNGQRDQVLANGGLPTAYSGAYGASPTSIDDVIVDGRIITGENPLSAPLFGTRVAEAVLASMPPVNQAPTASNAGWSLIENAANGTSVGTVIASDPDAGQTLTYAIIGGNDSGAFAINPTTGQITVANATALDFETNPVFHMTVQVTDSGSSPLSATAAVVVTLQDVAESGVNRIGSDLVITGTPGADVIYLWSGSTANTVHAWMNGTSYGSFVLPTGGRVVVRAGAGNDQVFASDLRVGAAIFGEAGHDLLVGGHAGDVLDGGNGVDRIWGGFGNDLIRGGDGDDYLYGREGDDILLGGAGNDTLEGFDGRDLLIGGLGADFVRGGAGDDILIGGTTTHDDDPAALMALHGLWLAPINVDNRISSLAAASGFLAPGSVIDDGFPDAMIGDSGEDWLLWNPGDMIYLPDPADRVSPV
jgi:putative intracellular protease/amidase